MIPGCEKSARSGAVSVDGTRVSGRRLRIGVLEDDPTLRPLYDLAFTKAGHAVSSFRLVGEFMRAVRRTPFDAVLLDWHLPDGTAAEPLQWIRQNNGWSTPVIVVSADGREASAVEALRAGADEYLVKPLRVQEALARLEARLRRLAGPDPGLVRIGARELDAVARVLRVGGAVVELTPKEFDLAALFLRNPGRLFSRSELLQRVWGTLADVETRTVDAHVSQLRRKAGLDGLDGWSLRAVYGRGYRLARVPDAPEADG